MAPHPAIRSAPRRLRLTMTALLGLLLAASPALGSTDVTTLPVYQSVGCLEVHVAHYPQYFAGGGCVGTIGVGLVDHTATSCWLVTIDGIIVGIIHLLDC